ncbi:hypothetical protein ASF25_14030 [Methylobacterium sp. Leaf100]|nr:hypothetical protein ASF25_14030 [Methylobacterium sp. Leaf100]
MSVEPEHQPHGLGFDRIDGEALLDPVAALLDLFEPVAQRERGAVIEALPGVLLHRPQHVLGVLAALVLVEHPDELAHHDLAGIVAEFLRDRDEAHADLGELADVHLQAEGIAEEPAEAVHDDDVEGAVAVTGAFDHPLELGSRIVHRRGARLDILDDDRPALGGTESGDLLALVGDREIGFRLSPGRDPQIAGRAQRPVGADDHLGLASMHRHGSVLTQQRIEV